ncbi:TonB-dependent receptor plug domain-containing protein [bacterium]|nr:TonB-dependent receptor plug domain-containing protein [bacterium]
MSVFFRFPVLGCLLSLLYPSTALAQNVVSVRSMGSVPGEADGVLEGAAVWIEGQSVGGFTDSTGTLVIGSLPEGRHRLHVASVGYHAQTLTVSFPLERPLTLVLQASGDLNAITVTGTLNEVRVRDAPVKAEVLSAQRIDVLLPRVSSSLIDAIPLVNGVREVVACGVCGTNSISINGLPGPYTAVLIDGMPVYGNLAAVYGLNGIPASAIDRIEVIKGPNSTLYGSEALAGVVNIVTLSPERQPLLSADFMATSHAELFGGLTWAPQWGKVPVLFSYNGTYANHFVDQDGDGFSDAPHLDRHSIFAKANIAGAGKRNSSVAVRYSYEDRRNGVSDFLDHRAYLDLRGNDSIYGESIVTRRWELFSSLWLWSAQDVKLDLSLSRHDQDSYYGADFYRAYQNIAFVNLTRNRVYGAHRILTGLGYRLQGYNDNTSATETSEGADKADLQSIPGLFAEDEWNIDSNWVLLTGMRVDYYRRHGWIASPRLNLKYAPTPNSVFRLNTGTGFRIVNLFTEDHAFVSGQREIVIAEELNPERSLSGNLNYNQQYTLSRGFGSIDVDVFYTHFFNKIAPDYSDPNTIVYANSPGFARTAGLGLNWNHSFAFPISWTLGGMLQSAQISEMNEDGKTTLSDLEFAPNWSGIFTLSYRRSGWSLGYTASITGPMKLPTVYDLDAQGNPLPDPRPTRSPVFARHTVQVQWNLRPDWMLYGGIQNLFDQIQSISPLVGYNDPNHPSGFSPYFDTSYAYAAGHGREFYLGLRWTLSADQKQQHPRTELP